MIHYFGGIQVRNRVVGISPRFIWFPAHVSDREVGIVLRFTSGFSFYRHTLSRHLYTLLKLHSMPGRPAMFGCYSLLKEKQLIHHLFCEAFSGQNDSHFWPFSTLQICYYRFCKYFSYLLALQLDCSSLTVGLDLNHLCICRSKLCNGVYSFRAKKLVERTQIYHFFFLEYSLSLGNIIKQK